MNVVQSNQFRAARRALEHVSQYLGPAGNVPDLMLRNVAAQMVLPFAPVTKNSPGLRCCRREMRAASPSGAAGSPIGRKPQF